ncbi:MAG: hypothetical protein M3134_08090 [Actinomycetota bacterium]|nr:hypothetical protein [Actinomycetota bacterium]
MDAWKDLGKIGAAVATLATALTAYSGSELVQRAARNHPWPLMFATGFAILASASWVAAALAESQGSVERWFQRIGVALFSAAILTGLGAVVWTQNDTERPSLSVTFDRKESTLVATVEVSNLSSRDRLAVVVDGLEVVGTLKAVEAYEPTNLYRVFLGPNSQGVAKQQIELPIPPGTYEAVGIRGWTKGEEVACEDYQKKDIEAAEGGELIEEAGCIVMALPAIAERPSVSLSVSKGRAKVDLAGVNVGSATMLQVVGGGSKSDRPRVIYRAVVQPSQSGALATSYEVDVPKGVKLLCVQADLADDAAWPAVSCPGDKAAGGYAELELTG